MSIKNKWWILLILIFIISVFLDVYTTYKATTSGDYYETNPMLTKTLGNDASFGVLYIYFNLIILLVLVGYCQIYKKEIINLPLSYKQILFLFILIVSLARLSGAINNIYA